MILRIEVFTIFPQIIEAFASESLIGRASQAGLIDLRIHDLRDWSTDAHHSVDDSPFGGGAGMVLSPEPVFRAVEELDPIRPLFLLSPCGARFDQSMAETLASGPIEFGADLSEDMNSNEEMNSGESQETDDQIAAGFSLICGRYEGVDERVAEYLVDGELSIGDFVLGGGEAAAIVVMEAVIRLVPGVMSNDTSADEESFSGGLLEYPQYTRPADFRGFKVPEVLLSGNHQAVKDWRFAQALARTANRRPDLIEARGGLTQDEVRLVARHEYPSPSPLSGS